MTAAMFLAFILFLILSFPVAIAMGLSSCVPALIDSSFSADFVYIIRTMVVGIDSTPILAIPLFIISGTMMAQGGISGKLFDVFSYFLGNKRAVCYVLRLRPVFFTVQSPVLVRQPVPL